MAGERLPPCGIYRTTEAIGDIPPGRLVYFHNHGDPGPGLYLPRAWQLNKARFEERGHTIDEPADTVAETLLALPTEGFYRVTRPFTCCEKQCITFETDLLVQLGYDGQGRALLFVPQLADRGLTVPAQGRLVEDDRWSSLAHVKIAGPTAPSERSSTLH